MFRKDSNVSLVCLISNKKILSAKIVEIDVALFWSNREIDVDNYFSYLSSYIYFTNYDIDCVVRANITTRDCFSL